MGTSTAENVNYAADYRVRRDRNALGDCIQVVRLDVGTGTTESPFLGSGLVPEKYDEITMSYTGDSLTGVVYKYLGSTIATLTLSYTGTNLTGVVRT